MVYINEVIFFQLPIFHVLTKQTCTMNPSAICILKVSGLWNIVRSLLIDQNVFQTYYSNSIFEHGCNGLSKIQMRENISSHFHWLSYDYGIWRNQHYRSFCLTTLASTSLACKVVMRNCPFMSSKPAEVRRDLVYASILPASPDSEYCDPFCMVSRSCSTTQIVHLSVVLMKHFTRSCQCQKHLPAVCT